MTPLDALPAEFRDAVRHAARMHGVSHEALVGEAWICATAGKTTVVFQSRVRRELAAQFSASRLAHAAEVWEDVYRGAAIPGEEPGEEPAPALSTREIALADGIGIRAAQIRRKKWLEKQRRAIESGQLLLLGGAQ
jgi:hypothetical protein